MASFTVPKAGPAVEGAVPLANSTLASIIQRAAALAEFRRAGPVRVLRCTPIVTEKGLETAIPLLDFVIVELVRA